MKQTSVLFLLAFTAPAVAGQFGDEGLPQLTTTGTLDIYKGAPIQALTITCPKEASDQMCWDDYVLTVTAHDKKINYPFTASYGRFHLYLPPMATYPWGDVVLLRSEGRGTSASSWYLDILAVESGKVVLKYEKIIGSYFGDGETWWYTVHFQERAPENNGNAYESIRLALEHDPLTHDSMENASLIPKDEKFTIYWDFSLKKYVAKTGWVDL